MKDFSTWLLINETMDKPYPWKIRFDGSNGGTQSGLMRFEFQSQNRKIWATGIFMAEIHSEAKPYECNFEFKDEKGSYDTTGDGDAFRIMATVLDIVKNIITVSDVPVITFDAEKGATWRGSEKMDPREKVYIRLVKRFASKHGFIAKIQSNKSETSFRLERK